MGDNMPLSNDPELRKKQLANLKPIPHWLIEEYNTKQGLLTKEAILKAAETHFPNLSAIARAIGVSRSLVQYHIDNNPALLEQMQSYFNSHLDEIEDNVLKTAKKEQYASSAGVFVLKSQHPRYREEKQSLTANVSINFGGGIVGNPYRDVEDAQEIPESEKPEDE